MDSHEGSAPMRNPVRLECESDKAGSSKSTPRQLGSGDNAGTVFTSVTNQTDCTSRPRHSNSLSVSDAGQQSSSSCGAESNINVTATVHPQACNINSNVDEPIASGSKLVSNSFENGIESGHDTPVCLKHKVCIDKAGNNCYMVPSTSGSSKDNVSDNIGFRESRKRPSSLKLNKQSIEDEDSSSDTGNDDYSLGSEDGCIYTYRGGEHLADLPSSFFSLDMGLPLDRHLPIPPNYVGPQPAPANAREQGSRASSPDMDFLEMDFDPGPSCEADTGDESTPDADLEPNNMPEEEEPVLRVSPEVRPRLNSKPASSSHDDRSMPSTSYATASVPSDSEESKTGQIVYYGPYITHVNTSGEQLLVRRTMTHWPQSAPVSLHVTSGNLVSPREMLNYEEDQAESPHSHQINQGERPAFDAANLSSALYHLNMAKKLMGEKTRSDKESSDNDNQKADKAPSCIIASTSAGASCVEPARSMVWAEREACERQVTQIATSACGATAVVNVFIALGVPVNIDKINSAVGTRQRANSAPLPRYLLSRSIAGCTAADLVTGIHRASDGLVAARFFPTYPERAVSLSHWLADWISLGAVPILTLNLQAGCEGEIPDAWHHQMVFGVSSRGIYLCNPVECVKESTLWPRLNSPSVLLVRARDVVSRFNENTDLTPLMAVPERRFHTFNVLGQVVNVIREWRATNWSEERTRTRHIRLPAAYQAGVTVAALTGSEAHRRLMHAAQLPILAAHVDI